MLPLLAAAAKATTCSQDPQKAASIATDDAQQLCEPASLAVERAAAIRLSTLH